MSNTELETPFNLLDASLDDIEDLPGFAVFPSGAHLVEYTKWESKQINEHPAVNLDLKLIQTQEMTEVLEPGEKAPISGDTQSLAFMLDNKVGLGMLKQFIVPLGEKLGIPANEKGAVRRILEGAKGMKLLVVQKRTYNKDKDAHYPKIKTVLVV